MSVFQRNEQVVISKAFHEEVLTCNQLCCLAVKVKTAATSSIPTFFISVESYTFQLVEFFVIWGRKLIEF